MKMVGKSVVLLFLAGLVLLVSFSCKPTVTQEEYDSLLNLLDQTSDELANAQQKGVEADLIKAQYDELNLKYNELNTRHEASLDEIDTLQAQYDALNTQVSGLQSQNQDLAASLADLQDQHEQLDDQYQLLQQEYDDLVTEIWGVLEINEANIAQALFDRINQIRLDNDLNVLVSGHNLEDWALINSQRMAQTKAHTVYTDSTVPYQQTFWATGYINLDTLVNAAMTVWQNNAVQFEDNFLSPDVGYIGIGVVKSGDIYYITYMASNFP